MSVGELIVYLIIALFCGLVGQMLAGRSVGGYIAVTVLGLVGGLLGGFFANTVGAPEPFPVRVGVRTIPILWAIVGAALLTVAVAGAQRHRTERD